MHGPHAPLVPNPVCVSVHVVNVPLEQREAGSEPESAELFERVSVCKDAGNAGGSGGWRLFESR